MAIVDIDGRKVVASIPLSGAPAYAVAVADANTLFVLSHVPAPNGDRGAGSSEVTIIDTSARRVSTSTPIKGHVTTMFRSKDRRSIVCISEGTGSTKPATPGTITVFDARSGETMGAVTLPRAVFQVLVTADLSSVFALSPAGVEDVNDMPLVLVDPADLYVFHTPRLTPGASSKVKALPLAMTLSSDDRWLYILDRGYHNHHGSPQLGMARISGGIGYRSPKGDNSRNHRDGTLQVFDAATGLQAASHSLGVSPWRMFVDGTSGFLTVLGFADDGIHGRLHDVRGKVIEKTIDVGEFAQDVVRVGGLSGRFVVAYDEVRFLPDEGGGAAFVIPVNKSKSWKGAPTPRSRSTAGRAKCTISQAHAASSSASIGSGTSRQAVITTADSARDRKTRSPCWTWRRCGPSASSRWDAAASSSARGSAISSCRWPWGWRRVPSRMGWAHRMSWGWFPPTR